MHGIDGSTLHEISQCFLGLLKWLGIPYMSPMKSISGNTPPSCSHMGLKAAGFRISKSSARALRIIHRSGVLGSSS
jgi:hypothetical protein